MENIELKNTILNIEVASQLRREFQSALSECADGDFVPRPAMLSKFDKQRRASIQSLQDIRRTQESELNRRARTINELLPNQTTLQSLDLAARSLWIQQQLRLNGAVFGESEFNFAINDLTLPKDVLKSVEDVALGAFSTIQECEPALGQGPKIDMCLNNQMLKPNGARVDIVLTKDGPKVIEVNMQWVDGIQALEAFQITYLGKTQKAVELLAQTFKGCKRLAILDITKGSGSRSSGSQYELNALNTNLERRFNFSEIENMDPRKIVPDYLRRFDALYINGEPRMIAEPLLQVYDWLDIIIDRSKRGYVFPIWRPDLDKKKILIEASRRSSVFAPTLPYSEENLLKAKQNLGFVVIKGDGYSSKSVGVEGTSEFNGISTDAKLFPDEFIIQPRLEPIKLDPMWCFDTSYNLPVYLSQPRSKFNVWIINGKVAGTLASISDRLVISDKDFNVVPKPI